MEENLLKMRIYMFIIMFFLIGAFFIISENHLALATSGNLGKFVYMYATWLSDIFDNSRDLAGYVIKLDWLPKN